MRFMLAAQSQHLRMGVVNRFRRETGQDNLPAPIVSPPRRISILPISLLTEKGSMGMGRALEAGPEYVELRRLISTSADMFLVNTL